MESKSAIGHILVIDDDKDICELLQINLQSEGYAVHLHDNAETVNLDELDNIKLVIVDAMSQSYSGMDFIYDLKDNPATESIAVILYSTIRSERMVIDALDAGADDYIVKPFSLRELLARVKSVIRRHDRISNAAPRLLEFKTLSLDPKTQMVKLDGQPLTLTKTEYAILKILIKNVDTFVPRVEIHRNVWNDDTAGANERIVDTNISRLRKKLGDLGAQLKSRTGHGYMLSSTE